MDAVSAAQWRERVKLEMRWAAATQDHSRRYAARPGSMGLGPSPHWDLSQYTSESCNTQKTVAEALKRTHHTLEAHRNPPANPRSASAKSRRAWLEQVSLEEQLQQVVSNADNPKAMATSLHDQVQQALQRSVNSNAADVGRSHLTQPTPSYRKAPPQAPPRVASPSHRMAPLLDATFLRHVQQVSERPPAGLHSDPRDTSQGSLPPRGGRVFSSPPVGCNPWTGERSGPRRFGVW